MRIPRTIASSLAALIIAALPYTSDAAERRRPVRPAPVEQPPVIAATFFSWYEHDEREDRFACTTVKPYGGPYDSGDPARVYEQLQLLRNGGVNAIGIITAGFKDEGLWSDEDSRASEELVIPFTRDLNMKYFAYYDTAIRSYWKSHFCLGPCPPYNPDYDSGESFDFDRFPKLKQQFVDDMTRIADMAVENRDAYLYLQDKYGRAIRDTNGGLRPVIGLYLARAYRDQHGGETIRAMVEEVGQAFAARGFGRPAFMLDIAYYIDNGASFSGGYEADQVAAFGASAVALTSFGPVDAGYGPRMGVLSVDQDPSSGMGEWAPAFTMLYKETARQIARDTRAGLLERGVQVWPGTMVNADFRNSCTGVTRNSRWPARGPEDARAMVRAGLDTVSKSDIRPLVVFYSGEYYEGAALCASTDPLGNVSYPNQYGCDPLRVLREELERDAE